MTLPVAAEWFRVRKASATVTVLTEPHVHEMISANVWHVGGRDRDLLVDSGLGLSFGVARLRTLVDNYLQRGASRALRCAVRSGPNLPRRGPL